MTDGSGTNRRRFLRFATNVLLLAIGLLLAIPAMAYFLAPLWARREGEGAEAGFVDAGPLADLAAGEWRLVALEVRRQDGWKQSRVNHAAWVRRSGKGNRDITVLSPICPHLGCPIDLLRAKKQFNCPCHGGLFDNNGRHIGGPPPRSMDPLAFEVRAGRLWVRWQDFKIGVAERIPVST